MMNRFVPAVMLAVFVVTGCSSSSKPLTPKTSGTEETTSAPTTSARSDQAIADAIKLRAEDLPGTWTTGAPETQDNSSNAQISSCLGIPDSTKAQTAYAGSPDFTQGNTGVYSEATVFNSASVVQSDLAGARSSKLIECVTQLAQDSGARNIEIKSVAMPSGAREFSGFHVTGSFELSGTTVHLDEVALFNGRIEADVNVSSRTAIPEQVVDAATGAIAKRLS